MRRRSGPVAAVLGTLVGWVVASSWSALRAETRSGEAADPLAATARMRAWARSTVAGLDDELDRLRALHRELFGPGPHAIAEITESTPSASEAFTGRRADCVGFALLLVSVARSVGIEARFVLSPVVEEVVERGSLREQRLHLAATFADRVFDLGGEGPLSPGPARPIADRTAIALYHSNRGVRALTSGDAAGAVEPLWTAVRLDPSLESTWTNLGVALRRSGDPAGAILAHEMALRIDSANEAACRNLEAAANTPQSLPD